MTICKQYSKRVKRKTYASELTGESARACIRSPRSPGKSQTYLCKASLTLPLCLATDCPLYGPRLNTKAILLP
uniref:Uncharacterized protein n=1 Tax=Pararge aegeria TaxID=116150 RepID=S4PD40_9NEOP